MQFKCPNTACGFTLTNEYCPKCGQGMEIGCSECVNKDTLLKRLSVDLAATRGVVRENARAARFELESLTQRHEQKQEELHKTIERLHIEREPREEKIKSLEEQVAKAAESDEAKTREAWRLIVEELEIAMPIGYVIDGPRVLAQLRIERAAAATLRGQLAAAKAETEMYVKNFATAREKYLAAAAPVMARIEGEPGKENGQV